MEQKKIHYILKAHENKKRITIILDKYLINDIIIIVNDYLRYLVLCHVKKWFDEIHIKIKKHEFVICNQITKENNKTLYSMRYNPLYDITNGFLISATEFRLYTDFINFFLIHHNKNPIKNFDYIDYNADLKYKRVSYKYLKNTLLLTKNKKGALTSNLNGINFIKKLRSSRRKYEFFITIFNKYHTKYLIIIPKCFLEILLYLKNYLDNTEKYGL
jgi:hypothetical protein